MDSSNSPSVPDTGITDYDSDATDEQSWDLVGATNLTEAGGSYVAALELTVRSLQKLKPADTEVVQPLVESVQEAAPPGEIVYRVDGKSFPISKPYSFPGVTSLHSTICIN